MIKVAFLPSRTDSGPSAIPLFGRADAYFEKTAAPKLLPEVARYIETLRPRADAQYSLVNAMGASEFWGPNVNADAFDQASLIHAPDNWTHNPLIDKIRAKDWPYGFPTFYYAHAFAHHANKDPSRAYGEVELAAWNPHMKRVELVTRVDKDRCEKFGGVSVWDRLKSGDYADVSMGCFKAGAQVTLADGTRVSIETIKVGDRVRTHTGGVGRVTELHRRMYRGQFFEIQPANEDAFVATRQHPFWAAFNAKDSSRVWQKKPPRFDWVAASDLDGAVLSHPKISETRETDVTRAWARIIGYYLAEGHVVLNKKGAYAGIELTVNKDDAVNDEIEALCAEVGSKNSPVWRQRENSKSSFSIGIYDSNIASMCATYAGRYSKTKKLAEEVLYWPSALQLELLGAYLNGDGFNADGKLCMSTASEDLVHQVREILFKLGIPTSYQLLRHAAGSGFSSVDTIEWVVSIGRQWSKRFVGFCAKAQANVIEKSKNVYADYGDTWAVPIREYTEFYDEAEVYNFEVEGDNSYLVNGVAVHNCKVPWDRCSVCTDMALFQKAQATFDPKKHKHPGEAVLAFHKALLAKNGNGIRGISITRNDYCFPAGTPILVEGGQFKNIEEICEEDLVVTHRGQLRRVLHTMRHEVDEDLILIDAYGFGTISATEGHPLFAADLPKAVHGGRTRSLSEGISPTWVDFGDARIGYTVFLPLLKITEDHALDRDLGWLLGLYVAEGHMAFSPGVAHPKGAVLTVHARERHLLDKAAAAAQLLDPEVRVVHFEYAERNAIGLRLNSRTVAEWLLLHGGRGSHTKVLHPNIWQYGLKFVLGFLKGWADGDGSLDKRTGALRVATSSEVLARQVQLLAGAAGILVSLKLYDRNTNFGHQRIWYASFGRGAAEALLEERPQTEFVRHGKLFLWGGYLCSTIRKIQREPFEGTVYNFEVEEDNSYVAGAYAVHNCKEMREHANEILPDGRKVFVYNDYPRFFDISFVFIGADKTAKVMMKIAGTADHSYWFMGGADLAEKLGYSEEEKTAAVLDKAAKDKASEIVKDTVPSQFTGKAVPLLTQSESDLPTPILDRMGDDAIKSLATATSLGMVLRPKEFQRVILIQLGQKPLADRLDDEGVVFPKSDQEEDLPLSSEDVSSSILRLLLPFFLARSSFGPLIERRVHLASHEGLNMRKHASSLSTELMCKLSAAYNGYRRSVMELVANAQALAESNALPYDRDLLKIAAAPVETVFTPLTAAFLKISYMDEFGISPAEYQSLRGEGFPLEEHAAIRHACGGH